MKDPGVPDFPKSRGPFGVTDEQMGAELRKWTGIEPALLPVGELLDRHWEAVYAYARLCTDGPQAAGMLTTAAFTRLFGQALRQSGPEIAWRPQLLLAVRRIAGEWSADHRWEMLHPELRTAGDGGDRAGTLLLPPDNRRLLSRAFQRLSRTARVLLWHTEVEAEPLAAPARLLGIGEEEARIEAERARERLREECLQVHRGTAPRQECLLYFRLLDVTYRRGDADLDPDLRTHLDGCTHCRHTADQLSQFNADLGAALAEGVLGWGARAYRDSRLVPTAPEGAAPPRPAGGEPFPPAGGEPFGPTAPSAPFPGGGPVPDPSAGGEPSPPTVTAAFGEAPGTGAESPAGTRHRARRPAFEAERAAADDGARPRTGGRRAAQRAARRAARQRNLALAVATVSGLVVLPLALWVVLGSGDGTTATGAVERPSGTPGSGSPSAGPSRIGADAAGRTPVRGRLHNVASGLCVGVVGKKAVEGAETALTDCASTPDQQWVYETDGLLRSGAAPELCLDSRLGYSVRLAPCTDPSGRDRPKDIRYDFTLQGVLIPRFDQDLALTPAATDGGGALVLKLRAKDDAQRWVMDASTPGLQLEVVHWDADGASSGRAPAPAASGPSSSAKRPAPAATATPAPRTTPRPTATGAAPRPADSCDARDRFCSGDRDRRHRRPGGHGYGYGYGHGYGGR